MDQKKIGFFGFGHMAQVLFGAMDRAKLAPRSHVCFVRRNGAKALLNEKEFGICSTSLEQLVKQSDLIFLCVKPQQVSEAIEQLKAFPIDGKMIVSILGGTTLSFLEKKLGEKVFVIRAMPNISSEVGEGMTILSFGDRCNAEFKEIVRRLFGAVGQVSVQTEAMMDIASSMAGCGPGFVVRLIQAMAQAGIKQGMSEEDALKIAAQTFIGAGKLVANGLIPADLIRQIATPQGMTAAGFESMDRTDVDGHLIMAIEAAAVRSKQLSVV